MKAFQWRFVLRLLLVSIAVYGVLFFIFMKLVVADLPLAMMVSLLFVVNSLAWIVITNTREKKPKSFVFSYMAVSMGRLLVCGAFVFIYALTHRSDARTFAITFFILYFLYTTIEVRAIYTFFKHSGK